MKFFLLMLILPFFVQVGQDNSSDQQPAIVLKGVQGEYKNLDEIKPVLVNESGQPIYLLPEDCGEARLRLFYLNKTWMTGVSKKCSRYETAIEIKPGDRYQIPPLVWRPLVTWDGRLIERKNFPGRYEVVMRYSLKQIKKGEWSKPQLKPVKHIMRVSKEFIIVP